MAGDKIILGAKSRPLLEKPKWEKEKKKKGPTKKLAVGLLKCSKSCLCVLMDGGIGSGPQVPGSPCVLDVYSLILSSLLKNMVWRTVFKYGCIRSFDWLIHF